jgi:tRNA (guanine-N7-)-methyltransferase
VERITIKSYRARGTRITSAQEVAREELWPKYGIEMGTPIDPAKLFPGISDVIVEIGYGMGEATAHIAENSRDRGFIAIEVHKPGIGKLITLLESLKLTNVKLIDGDAHEALMDMVPDHSLAGVHLFFPDPWPKSRHHKRRIVNAAFLALVHQKLKPGGFIHIATDWHPYAEWMKEVFTASPLFTGGEVERPEWRPRTRFESKGITTEI